MITREEAIASYEKLYDYIVGDDDTLELDYGEFMELNHYIRSALRPVSREQVEKVRKGEWVKRHKHRGGFRRVKGFDDMGEQHEVTIDERCEYDDLYCSKCGKQSPDNFLNFCGYCGAPMTDEAVEMVMERMEAIR